MIRQTTHGVEIAVRVIARSRKTEIAGIRADAVLVRLAAVPVGGAANAALIEVLAERFAIPKRAVRIIAGDRSRHKRVAIDGISEEMARRKL